jgi:predicted DNA-binding protein with PD1-like motif
MLEGKTGRVFFFRLFEDEDLAEAIKKRVEESGIKAGFFLLIGTLKNAVLGYYKGGQYKAIRIEGPLEIASCMGNIAVDEKGELIVHAHVVVSNEKGEAFGGHLMKDSYVGATAELVIVEAGGVNLQRALDEKTGLKLWKLG